MDIVHGEGRGMLTLPAFEAFFSQSVMATMATTSKADAVGRPPTFMHAAEEVEALDSTTVPTLANRP